MRTDIDRMKEFLGHLTSVYSVVISVHVQEYFERGWRTTYSKRVMYANNVTQNPINIVQVIGVDMKYSLQDMLFALCIVVSVCPIVSADDGYDLWMSYKKLDDVTILKEYQKAFSSIVIQGDSDTLRVIREEVKKGLKELLGVDLPIHGTLTKGRALVIGTPKQSPIIQELDLSNELAALGHEGYLIRSTRIRDIPYTIITANKDIGLLYGSLSFIETYANRTVPHGRRHLLQTSNSIPTLESLGQSGRVNRARLRR